MKTATCTRVRPMTAMETVLIVMLALFLLIILVLLARGMR
jgi:hypothetical protein